MADTEGDGPAVACLLELKLAVWKVTFEAIRIMLASPSGVKFTKLEFTKVTSCSLIATVAPGRL